MYSIATLPGRIGGLGDNPSTFDGLALGFDDGTVAHVHFTGIPESIWYIASGLISQGDRRHNKSEKRFRIIYRDIAPNMQFILRWYGDRGEQRAELITIGTGSGAIRNYVASMPPLTGMYVQWTISGEPGSQAAFEEFALYYTVEGEFKNA